MGSTLLLIAEDLLVIGRDLAGLAAALLRRARRCRDRCPWDTRLRCIRPEWFHQGREEHLARTGEVWRDWDRGLAELTPEVPR